MSAERAKSQAGKAPAPDEMILDFSGVKPFEPLLERGESGKEMVYLCVVENIEPRSGPKGPMEMVTFTVQEPEEYKRRKLFRNYSLTTEALPFLHEFIKACNPKKELGEAFRWNRKEYLGAQVGVTVQNEEYQEQIRSRPKKIWPKEKYTG